MHSKAALVFSESTLRVMICTANYIQCDWESKTQGCWYQDFPRKQQQQQQKRDIDRATVPDATAAALAGGAGSVSSSSSLAFSSSGSSASFSATAPSHKTSEFEEQLVSYFAVVGGVNCQALRAFDFSQARGLLVASVPGTHTGRAISRWGHMRLRTLLRAARPVVSARRFDTVCCQFSSLGSLSEKWCQEDWLPSVSGGVHNPALRLEFVIPTESEVGSRLSF